MAELVAAVMLAIAVLVAGAAPLMIFSWRKGREFERTMSAVDDIQNERDEVSP